jgi:hypothetical protein
MYKNRIMKPIRNVLKWDEGEKEDNREGEFDQSTFYACMGNHNETPCAINIC